MDTIIQIDTTIFYFINVTMQNVVFDWLMPFITEKKHWFPVWIITAGMLIWKGGKKGRIFVLLIIPLITLSDQVSSSVLKPFFERTRPCGALENIHLLVKMKTSFSFPSSHAANFFATATFFNYFYPKYRWWYFFAAIMVGLSRVSIGVHYPFDILAGGILGAICAYTIILIWNQISKYFKIDINT